MNLIIILEEYLMPKTSTNPYLIITLSTTLSLMGCSGGGSSTSSASGGQGSLPQIADGVNIGQMSVIPMVDDSLLNKTTSAKSLTANNSGASYKLAISNNTAAIMHIDSLVVNGKNASSANVSNGSCGSQVQSKNSCYLSIIPPSSAGSFTLTVNYHNGADQTPRKMSQLIQYGEVVANNGYYYSNNNSRVVTSIDQTKILSFPIVLADNYTNLTTKSNSNSTIDCGGKVYTKGTACTLTVATKGTKADNIARVNLVGTLSSGLQNTLNFNTLVTTNPSPNLIAGGMGLVISPANGNTTNQVEVTVFNSGTGDATNLQITPTAPVTVNTSGLGTPCGATLAAQAECSFNVNASDIVSGQNNVVISDDEGDSQSLSVYYIAESASPALTLTYGGGLENAVSGYESKTLTVNIANTSTTNTSMNVKLSNLGVQNQYLSYITDNVTPNKCSNVTSGGSFVLPKNNSCNLVINYAPPLAAGAQNGNFTINPVATYTNASGESQTYAAASGSYSYSSTLPVAAISITPTTTANNKFLFNILPNGVETQAQTFTFTNTGNVPATVNNFTSLIAGSSLNGMNIVATNNNCNIGGNLDAGSSCSYNFVYGPLSAEQESLSAQLGVTSTNSVTSEANSTEYYYISSQALDSKMVLSDISYSTDQGTNWTSIQSANESGGGAANPITFTNYNAHPVYLRYIYANTGTEAASNLNINLNDIPAAYGVVANLTTCPYATNTAILNIGASCNVVLKAVDYSKSAIFSNGAGYISGALNINTPAISYTSPNTGVHKNQVLTYAPTADIATYLTANLFGSNTWGINQNGGTQFGTDWFLYIDVHTITKVANESPVVNLNVSNWGPGFSNYETSPPPTVIDPNSWAISATGAANLIFTIPAYMPAIAYTFPYTVTSGYDATTSYQNNISFTLQ